MKLLDIGEITERSGVKPSTLRYYEEVGLIQSITRHGLRRQYEPQILTKLSLITLAKAGGFSLTEIAGMFSEKGQLQIPREQIRERADLIDEQIKELTALRDVLHHVADCPAPSHMECPSFQRMLKASDRRKPAKKKPPTK
ncbi:Redox-sensitive transcriptional activator SoxR [Pseudovibrio sp. W64]|jgi:DNA-binding transcriptional MerR regulator|uniref:helix-turn-helix domain-containing protein n=1 Tax=unclassified Pseudovibrio TaxID=2627060 RepID=UPI00070BD72E|nr:MULTISPECIES: helix-turn-helix domain-containing protein [unclassified Pseudovibrio]KZK77015.1 Redox-sensitive transcriptional activator SoxR [Pseudovibrio sp. Ad46]KZK80442.1 Redox-sensitive transcriptional activator SoxR [Pseudovibrio sp. Ad13]KZK83651.1 Redox-sensitive transcriptional activator SoxR [Pseudovibrio sp. W64]KZK89513.1 Redox-sensitive transcriptional activator SoxR [Pseudovibrio sp. Ad5]KZK94735.1 Redox-sensitive transcriptional activator SoxR [Pseudovibrio sp. W74]